MNSLRKVLLLISIFILSTQVEAKNVKSGNVFTVKSPDGKIRVDINKGTDSKLYYKIEAKGKEIITTSRLGIVTDNVDLGADFSFGPSSMSKIDETIPVFGVHNLAINKCNTLTIEMQTAAEKWFLDVRAYNDGIGIQVPACSKKRASYPGRIN